jgi:hypothetical protein
MAAEDTPATDMSDYQQHMTLQKQIVVYNFFEDIRQKAFEHPENVDEFYYVSEKNLIRAFKNLMEMSPE